MPATYEQLVSAGMTEAQARLLANEDYGKRDLTRNPMVVLFAATFLAFQGWLALSVTNVAEGLIRLEERLIRLEERQIRLEEGQIQLEEGQIRLEAEVGAINDSLAD